MRRLYQMSTYIKTGSTVVQSATISFLLLDTVTSPAAFTPRHFEETRSKYKGRRNKSALFQAGLKDASMQTHAMCVTWWLTRATRFTLRTFRAEELRRFR